MATIGEINVRIGASLDGLQKGLAQTERMLRRSGAQLSRLGEDLSISLTAPLAAIGGAAIKVAGDMQALENSLVATMGSADAAQKELKELQRIAQLPGINLEQAVKGSVRLQAVGLDAGTARKAIENFANAVTLAGGTSADLDGVTLALTQIISKGKVSAEEINQIAERVPQIRAAMKNAFGTADTEVLQKMKIDATEFVQVVTAEIGKLPKATGGIRNAIENAGMAVQEFLARVGSDLNKTFNLEQVAKDLATNLSAAIEWFSQLDDTTRKLIYTTAGLLAAIGPVLKVYGVMKGLLAQSVSVVNTVIGAFGKFSGTTLGLADSFAKLDAVTRRNLIIGLAALAIAIGAGIKTWYDYSRAVNAAEVAEVNVKKAVEEANATAGKEIATLGTLINAVKDTAAGTDARRKAVENLKAAYPDYLKGQDLEKASVSKLTVLQSDLTREILKSVAARKKASAMEEIVAKQAEAMLRVQQLRSGADFTTTEAAKIDTGDWIKAGSRREAIIQKLQQDIESYGQAVTKTATDFDQAFAGISSTAANRGSATAAALKEIGRGTHEVSEGTNKYASSLQTVLDKGEKEKTYLTWKADLLKQVAEQTKEAANWQKILAESNINTSAVPTLQGPNLEGQQVQSMTVQPMEEQLKAQMELMRQYATSISTVVDPALLANEARIKAVQAAYASFNETMAPIGNAMTQLAASGSASFRELGNAALGAAAKVVRAKLMETVATYIAQNAKLGPFGAILGLAGAAAVGFGFNAIMKSLRVPALAQGGLAYGPTYAMVGDNKNAGADPEVIAPLSKLRGMLEGIGGGGGSLSGTLRADGKDLLLVLEQQQRMKSRTGR